MSAEGISRHLQTKHAPASYYSLAQYQERWQDPPEKLIKNFIASIAYRHWTLHRLEASDHVHSWMGTSKF